MKTRSAALFCLFVLLLNIVGSPAGYNGRNKAQASSANQLAALLPASDGIVTLDAKRFFNTALPKLLSANQPLLDKITIKIDQVKAQTGIDVRQFDYIAGQYLTFRLNVPGAMTKLSSGE